MDDDGTPLPPRAAAAGRAFDVRRYVVAPGAERAYCEDEWRGALVMVVRGGIDVVCRYGGRRCFERGDLLWFDGLPIRMLHNRGTEPAVLVAIARTTT